MADAPTEELAGGNLDVVPDETGALGATTDLIKVQVECCNSNQDGY